MVKYRFKRGVRGLQADLFLEEDGVEEERAQLKSILTDINFYPTIQGLFNKYFIWHVAQHAGCNADFNFVDVITNRLVRDRSSCGEELAAHPDDPMFNSYRRHLTTIRNFYMEIEDYDEARFIDPELDE